MDNVAKPSSKHLWVDRRLFSIQGRFHRNYNEESDNEYFLKVYVQYMEKLYELHNDLPFLPGKMKIEKA